MKQISLLLTIIVLTALGAGCSTGGGNNSEQSSNVEAVSELSPANITDAKVALAEGTRLLDENQTESAIAFLQHAVSLDPDLAEGHFKLGIAFALLEMQYQQEGVVTETPSNATGRTKPRSERAFERAVTAYEKWLDANPDDDAAHFNLGRTYSKLTKDEEAEKAFKQAVKLKPDDSEYQTELGAILIKLAKYHEAIAPLKKAIELDAENVRAEDLLEEAQAGRQRLDYVSPKPDSNKSASNTDANSSSATDSNSNTKPPPRPTNANVRPVVDPSRTPTPATNRPN
jgi:Flp pilus assembly protein TadD